MPFTTPPSEDQSRLTTSSASKPDSTEPVVDTSIPPGVRTSPGKPIYSPPPGLAPKLKSTAPPPGLKTVAQGFTAPPPSREKQAPKVESVERAQNAYKQLSIAAKSLNEASDQLAQVIGLVDKALKTLNLGISAWVQVSGGDDGGHEWWSRDIGYGKVADKWGIALRTREGDHRSGDDTDKVEAWLFNEAPRWMRVESIGKIPELLERLVKQANETTQSIQKKTAQASEIALAIFELAEESEPGVEK